MIDFKIRASASGQIVGLATNELTPNQVSRMSELLNRKNGDGKPLTDNMMEELRGLINKSAIPAHEALPKTCTSYLERWVKEQVYDRRERMTTKYIEKGLVMEDQAIDLVAEYTGAGLLLKNETWYENDYMTGTPDVVLKNLIIDVKCVWDCFTFPLFDKEIPNIDYYWQGQCYMNLTGVNSYMLAYCLMDTPEYLIEKEFKYNNFKQLDYEEFREYYIYSNLPIENRIKVFEFQSDDSAIEKLNSRVIECREYIKSLVP